MDQILSNSTENDISKNTRLEGTKKKRISGVSESSIYLKSSINDHEKYHLRINECFSKLTTRQKNARSIPIGNFKNFNECITGNHEKEKDASKIKTLDESRIETVNIKNFFKVIKKPEHTLQTSVNNTNIKINNKKRNWDSSSEDDSHERDFLTKTHKKIKCKSPNENRDIRKIFEKLRDSYVSQKDSTQKKLEKISKISNDSETKLIHTKYSKQNRIVRINSSTNQKQRLRKCQSLEPSSHDKVDLQINSMPLTEKECKAAEKKVRDEKITFNEFMAKVLRNMQRKNEKQTKSTTNSKKIFERSHNTTGFNEITEESPERTDGKTILDILKSLKQNRMSLQKNLHSKKISPQKVCLEDARSQIYSSKSILVDNGNEMCGLDLKTKTGLNRSCLENENMMNSKQCNKYNCQITDDSTQTGGEKTIYNVLKMLTRNEYIDNGHKPFSFLESDRICDLNNSSKKQIKINSWLTTTQLKLAETETIVDFTKSTESSSVSIHSPEISPLKILKNKFQSRISNCESESEKSIDFAMYLSPSNHQQYKLPLLYNSDNISNSLHRNPNSSVDTTSQNEIDFKCQDLSNSPQASESISPPDISLKTIDSFKIGAIKPSSDSISSEVLSKEKASMTFFKVPNATLLKEILNMDDSIGMYDKTEEAKHGAKRSELSNCGFSLRTLQDNAYINKPDIPEKNKKMPISSNSGENLLEDELVKTILTENYEKFKRRKETEVERREKVFDDLLEKLSQQISRDAENAPIKGSKKNYPKRYKKGKLRIYRLKKLKKIRNSTEPEKENLDFDELLKKITQDFIESKPLSRSKSGSSISTTSSYITDDTRSETLSTGSKELSIPQQKLRKGLNKISKDKSLFCEEEQMYCTEYNKDEIKMKIQNIFLRIFDDLTNGRKAVLKLRRQSFGNCIFKNGRLQFKPADKLMMSVISANVPRSKAKFKLILYILKKIQILLETNTKLTKRELFYQLKSLIGDQRVTDRAINSISCLLDVGMWALNIVAQKGLVFGNLKLLLSSGETLNCNVPGTMIPQDIGEIIEIQSSAYFILVVEKESIFHKLIEEDLPNKLTRSFIMITGKGFPDLNTQLFLRKLWVVMSIPIFILVDADPHGINIMLNYRFGSVNNAHVSHHLAVPKAKWLGVFPSEIGTMDITRQTLSEREVKLAEDLLKTPYMAENPQIVNELKVLIERKYKAGIEGLIKSNVFLSEVYLPTKFYSHNFI